MTRDLARILKMPVQIRCLPQKCLSWGQAASAARKRVTAGGSGGLAVACCFIKKQKKMA